VTSEACIDHDLLFVVGFLELEKEDAGGEVVDVRYSEGRKFSVELVRDDLGDY
jgi:hypothetical protein